MRTWTPEFARTYDNLDRETQTTTQHCMKVVLMWRFVRALSRCFGVEGDEAVTKMG
jgi:hypothetical protein